MGPLLEHPHKCSHDISSSKASCHSQVPVLEVREVFDGRPHVKEGRLEASKHLEGQLG